MKPKVFCELCKAAASLYCEADSAFLCWSCDRRVHGANFLVARHVRRIACAECHFIDSSALLVSGAGSFPIHSVCRFCDPDPSSASESESSSSSSSCISSAESTAPSDRKARPAPASVHRRQMEAVEGRAWKLMAIWSRRIGLRSGCRCVDLASHVLEACSTVIVLPFRVSLAAALWFSIKICKTAGGRTCEVFLRRLEACSGVPSKIIVLAESRLARVMAGRHRGNAVEGWAECL